MDLLKNLIPQQITKQDAALDPLATYSKALMTGGLPDFNALKDFSSGTVAQNSAPARGSLIRSLATSGIGSGSPAGAGVMSDFNASRARAYDANMQDLIAKNQQAKQAGAGNLAAVAQARNPANYLSMYGTSVYS